MGLDQRLKQENKDVKGDGMVLVLTEDEEKPAVLDGMWT